MPEEPEDGAADWLLRMDAGMFEQSVVPTIDAWLAEEPD